MIQLLQSNPDILEGYREKFQYFLVDEVQDLNKIQQVWLQLLVGPHPEKLTCVGDDD